MSIFKDLFDMLDDEDLDALKAFEAPNDPPLPDDEEEDEDDEDDGPPLPDDISEEPPLPDDIDEDEGPPLPEDDESEPPLPEEESPSTNENEPPAPDNYDVDLDAANQQIEDAGAAAVADDFPDESDMVGEEPPVGDSMASDGDVPPEGEEVTDEVPMEEEPLPEEGSMEDPNIEYQKKLRIHRNCKRLLAITKSSRDSFEQKFSSKITGKQYVGYHKIINAFEDLYDITQRILTEKFTTESYRTLIRHYVSLVKVYDIITKMTENFVEIYIKENEETNP